MKTAMLKRNPVTIKEGYGIKGMELELNLAQIQVLGTIYQSLLRRPESLSGDEQDLLPFLKTFKDFSLDRDSLWNNFKEEEPVVNNMEA